MIDTASAIKSLGDYEFVIEGEVNSQSDWDNNVRFISGADENDIAIFTDIKPVTYAEVLAKQTELQADYDAKQYQRDREYPSIGEQLDMQYWDAVNGTTTWKDAIAQVKADNPKPTE